MRYWKLISISIISILALGTFYIQSALAENNSPEFTFTHKSGDEEAVKDLMLRGTYYEGEKSQNVTVKTNRTNYSNGLSILEQINPYFIDPEIKQLQKEYRSFMRGKENTIASFYENEEMLVYADVDWGSIIGDPDFTFDIEVLEKNSGDTKAFQLEVPERNKYGYIYVEDVRVKNNELKVITRQNVKRTNQVEFQVYSFDVSAKELIREELIASLQDQNGTGWSYTDFISNGSSFEEINENVAFKKVILEEVRGEEGMEYSEAVGAELIVYNLETAETKNVKLPEEIEAENHTAAIIGKVVYFGQQSQDGIELIAFDMESEKIVSQQKIPFKDLTKIKNGNMYLTQIYSDLETPLEIIVVDLDTGETVYEGIVEMENSNGEQADYELYMNEILNQ